MAGTVEALPTGWANTTLGEILPIKYGKALATKYRNNSGSIPVYGSSGIVGTHDESHIPGPSLIVGRKGTVGAVHFSAGPSWPIDTTYYVTSTPDTNLRFFGYLLSLLRLRDLDRSTAIPGLSRPDYERIPIPLPPLPEQRRIVAEIEKQFTRLDASVAALRRTQANLKRYRASVLRAACSGELAPTEAELARAEGREYEPAGVLLERILTERRARWESQEKRRGKYKEPAAPDTSDLPPLPEGWAWATLAQTTEIQGGIQKQPKRAPTDNAYPFLRVANVLRSDLDLNEVHLIQLFPGELEKLRLVAGDLLIVEGNGSPAQIGRMAVWNGQIEDCVHQNHIIRARAHPGVAAKYVETYWNSPIGSASVLNVASSTSGLYTLSVSKVGALPVPLPPLAEQRRIVAEVERRLSVIQQAETAVDASLQRAERLRQSILKRAFSGQLVPQDPDDEPASALLDRIRAQREEEQAAAFAAKKPPARRRQSKATV